MKTIYYILSFILFISFTSCQDDIGINTGDEDSTPSIEGEDNIPTKEGDVKSSIITEDLMTGDWEITEYETYTETTTSLPNFSEIITTVDSYASDLNNAKYHFLSNKNMTATGEMTLSSDISLSTNIPGFPSSSQNSSQINTIDLSIGTGAWYVSNGVVYIEDETTVMIDENGNVVASIITWEQSEMKSVDFDGEFLTMVGYFIGTTNSNGSISTNEISSTMVLRKV